MEISKISYKGDLRTEAVHLASGNQIITDAPVDNHGKGEAFSPTDLLSTSLGSCMLTIIGIAAKTHGFIFNEAEVKVSKFMGTQPRRVIKIGVEINIKNHQYSDKEKHIIINAAKTCPVAHSLHPEIVQEVQINFYD